MGLKGKQFQPQRDTVGFVFHLCLVSHWLGELPFCCAYGGIAVHHLRDFSSLQNLNQRRLSLSRRADDDHLHQLTLFCFAQLGP